VISPLLEVPFRLMKGLFCFGEDGGRCFHAKGVC
jgi:hypothetical protein